MSKNHEILILKVILVVPVAMQSVVGNAVNRLLEAVITGVKSGVQDTDTVICQS